MDYEVALAISASALSAQRIRMNVIASNLANATTTRTPEGGPYRRRDVLFEAVPVGESFSGILRAASRDSRASLQGVAVQGVVEDPRPFQRVYQPGHPDADAEGYVLLPNVNPLEEMVNLIAATRAYEANVTAINATKAMALKALEIGR